MMYLLVITVNYCLHKASLVKLKKIRNQTGANMASNEV